MSERRYALTKLDAGDYLLPSNDAMTIWRISRYDEDGSLVDDEGRATVGTFWQVAWLSDQALQRRVLDGLLDIEDMETLESWSPWTIHQCLLPSRKAAIESVL